MKNLTKKQKVEKIGAAAHVRLNLPKVSEQVHEDKRRKKKYPDKFEDCDEC